MSNQNALKYTDEELCKRIIDIQTQTPYLTEGAVCGELGVARDYIRERAKKSETVSVTRKRADALRELAWIEKGWSGLSNRETFNATVYIWMTRNILKWTDKIPHNVSVETDQKGRLIINLGGEDGKDDNKNGEASSKSKSKPVRSKEKKGTDRSGSKRKRGASKSS